MKLVISIIAFVVAVFAGFFGVGTVLPDHTHIERSVVVNAEPEVVFAYTADHREFPKWSPWAALDDNMQVEFFGPAQGVGSVMSWTGNEAVGIGKSTFIEYEPNTKATVELAFQGMGGGTASYLLKDEGEQGTKLTWTFDTKHENVFERYIGLMIDGKLGPVYEAGLAKLKEVVESAPAFKSEEVSYTVDGTEFTGYLAYPFGLKDPVPGILIVHEWWGHNDYVRERADMLAKMGYVAFALDMYGDGKLAQHPQDANAFMQEVGSNTALAQKRFDAGLDILRGNSMTSPTKIAAIGYCFGGSVVINMARSGKPLAGVVSFHGGLGTLSPIAENANARMLVLNGAADPFIQPEHIDAFKKSMEEARLDYEFVNYEGAKHAFTNPGATAYGEKFELPLEYNEQADKKSWEKMQTFLNDVFY